MEANSTHISLETAKLLKDCKVESECGYYATAHDNYETYSISGNRHYWKGQPNYPAYTWQEILWEYPERFFWGKNFSYDAEYDNEWANGNFIVFRILQLLQQKEYDEADEYFRRHCILITR
jgi:hypothetical protein